MIGFIYLFAVGAAYVVGNIKENVINNENKSKFAHENGLTYIDSRGRTRLISNNRLVSYSSAQGGGLYGDYVLVDLKNGDIIRNFTEEKRKRIIKELSDEAKKNGKTTFPYYKIIGNSCNIKKIYSKFGGEKFYDINTGRIFVIRKLGEKYYYIDINSGLIVRETDYSRNELKSKPSIDIKKFNEDQSQNIKYYDDKYEPMYCYYS